jgi:hypothetical protein
MEMRTEHLTVTKYGYKDFDQEMNKHLSEGWQIEGYNVEPPTLMTKGKHVYTAFLTRSMDEDRELEV